MSPSIMDAVVTELKADLRKTAFPWSRWCEFTAGFVVLPVLVGLYVPPVWWVPSLWIIAGAAWCALPSSRHALHPDLTWARFWRGRDPDVWRVLLRFLTCTVLLTAALAIWMPHRLFDFPRHQPLLWLAIMMLYPALSVYPQELLYRRYFFFRYRLLYRTEREVALASAIVFAWMHLIFRNEFALIMTLIGGWFFADTYRRTGSLRLACIEHALYGNLVFTIGLGEFIYHGAVRV